MCGGTQQCDFEARWHTIIDNLNIAVCSFALIAQTHVAHTKKCYTKAGDNNMIIRKDTLYRRDIPHATVTL